MYHWILFSIQNVILPLVIAYGVLRVDQYWHGKMEFNRAYARSLSLGIDSKKHPDKVTLEALFIASKAELEYACTLVKRNFVSIMVELNRDIQSKFEVLPAYWEEGTAS